MKLSTLGLAIGLCIGAATGALAQSASAPLEGRYAVRPLRGLDEATVVRQAAAGATVPMWNGSAVTGGQRYSFTMVGKNPTTPLASQTTTIKTLIIPVAWVFETSSGKVTLDPTLADSACLSGDTAVKRVLQSPIFQKVTYTHNSQVGTGQFVDLFQRANFFEYTKSGSLNPAYHIVLSPTVEAKVTRTVANANKFVQGGLPCGKLGLVGNDALDSYLQTTLIPKLAQSYLTTDTFPIFLFYNVVQFGNGISDCCILGYHGAMELKGRFLAYGVVDFDSTRAFSGTGDVSIMSHEVAEWLDDPTGNNGTPSWGHTGQVSGCQNNLEVGDPLSGKDFPIGPMSNGVTYHVQDLAFESWFYHLKPSLGVNGWYSLLGTFKSPAKAC